MKRKDLIQLIKTKASEVEVKDFSASIVEKAKHLPKTEVIEKPGLRLSFKPFYLVALGTLTALLLVIVFYQPGTPPIEEPNLEVFDEAIAVSAISTASLIELAETELSSQSIILLSLEDASNSPFLRRIDDELDDVVRYMEVLEKLLASDQGFNVERPLLTDPNYGKQLRFRTRDLTNTQVTYTLRYNQQLMMENKRFRMEGVIDIGQNSYQMIAEGSYDTDNQVTFKAIKSETNYVEMTHVVSETQEIYEISIVRDGELIQKVTMDVSSNGSTHQITLSFDEGASIGTYQFEIDHEATTRVIQVNYEIDGTIYESGELVVRIAPLLEGYQILVMPEGRMPFTVTKTRGMSETRNRPAP